MRRRGRAGDAALDLRRLDPRRSGGERHRLLVRLLLLDGGPVDGPAVEAGRRAGLQAPEGEAEPLERLSTGRAPALADPAGRDLDLADMDQAAQEGAGGEDDGPPRGCAPSATGAGDAPRAIRQIVRLPSTTVRFGAGAISACMARA